MGFLDFLRSRKNISDENMQQQETQEASWFEIPSGEYIQELSLFELQKIDYVKFASELKSKGLLPPSYDKKPSDIQFSYELDGSPKIELTFNSKNTVSVRKLTLYNNGYVCEEVNGKKKHNLDVENVWMNTLYLFKVENKKIRQKEIDKGFMKAKKLIKEGNRLEDFMSHILDRENFILDRNKNKKFVQIERNSLWGTYTFYNDNEDSFVPETPKELELCVLNLTDNLKRWLAYDYDFDYFNELCQSIKNNSLYESDDWDVVIKNLHEHLVAFYREYERTYNEEELEG